MNYYRRYLGDYMRDTMHLSMIEHGAYTLLLDAYYASEKPLSAEYDALYRVCRAMSRHEQEAVKAVADRYFPVTGDNLRHNGRADREIGVAQTTIEKQRKSGVEAAAKRWGNSQSADKSDYGLTHESTDSQTIQPPTTNHQPYNHQPPGFTLFWADWPKSERKQGKSKCLAIWRRKNLEPKAAEILAHVASMKETKSWREGYEPMPQTYLNGERWDGAEVSEGKEDML